MRHVIAPIVFAAALVHGAAAETASLSFARPAPTDQPAPSDEQKALAKALDPSLRFGDKGWWGWSVGGGVAFSSDSTDYNAAVTFHHFLADTFEINFGVGGWFYDQDEGDQAVGVNPAFGFRWHFWMPKEKADHSWSVYADVGIGMVFTDERVPPEGTRYNFTPRAGVGATIALGDSGTRLDVGVRWAHVSNASTSGTDDNPSRDSPMVYAGVMFPF